MKTSKIMTAILALNALLSLSTARADDAIFSAQAGADVSIGTREAPDQALLGGTVTLSQKGEIKVRWDGVTVNFGDVTAGQAGGASGDRTYVSTTLPTLYLDLQKIFGVNWMQAIRLKVAGGSYANDPVLGKADLTLGTISVNLTQTVLKTKAVQWTVDEGVETSGYFRRQLYNAPQAFEAVPVTFSVNTQLVANISAETVVAISMGAYANITSGINQNAGFEALLVGGYITPSVTFQKHWQVGAKLEGVELIQLAGGDARKTALNASAFVKYMFTTGRGRLQNAIELSVGALDNGLIPDANGHDTRAEFAGLKYSVAF